MHEIKEIARSFLYDRVLRVSFGRLCRVRRDGAYTPRRRMVKGRDEALEGLPRVQSEVR